MNEQELNKKWNIKKVMEETLKTYHNEPSPETRERLKALEVNQTFMVQEISEIKQLVKGLNDKLDNALEKKADKSEVEKIENTIRWVAYLVIGGVITALLALVFK